MNYYLAVFSSITFANKIKKILDKQIGFTTLMHTPTHLKENGCSYCLRFREELLNSVILIARQNNIRIQSIYKEENGKYIKIQ